MLGFPAILRTPRVSVITNSYNARRFLGEHIKSMLREDFDDWEHLIVDCGSTDGSLELIESFMHPRLRLVQVPFCGVAKGRGLGIAEARGELVAILDADDANLPDRLSRQVRLLDDQPEVVACGGGIIQVDERTGHTRPYLYPSGHRALVRLLMAAINAFPHSTLMFRRSSYDTVGGYSEVFEKSEDFDFLLKLARVGELASIPRPVARYTIHDDSHTFLHRPEGRDAKHYAMLAVLVHALDGQAGATAPSVAAVHKWLDGIGPDGMRALCARWAVPGTLAATLEMDAASLRYYLSALVHWGGALIRHRGDDWWSYSSTPEHLATMLAYLDATERAATHQEGPHLVGS